MESASTEKLLAWIDATDVWPGKSLSLAVREKICKAKSLPRKASIFSNIILFAKQNQVFGSDQAL
jgi:hypothetical protein